MKNILKRIESISKWYGLIVIFIYAVLFAEFVLAINKLYISSEVGSSGLMNTLMRINYVIMVLASVVVWIICCLLFHLTALLFNGKIEFSKFLFAASYPFIIPAIAIFMSIMILSSIDIEGVDDMTQFIEQNSRLGVIMNIVNYSFIPYYLVVICIIHYLYNLKWLYALLSVTIPVLSIWGITELFSLL